MNPLRSALLAVLILLLVPAAASATPPVNVVPPTIEGGPPVVGRTLTINPGTWAPTPSYYTQAWERCTAEGTECVLYEPNQNATTYTPVAADVGHKLRAIVAAWNSLNQFSWMRTSPTAVTTAPVSSSPSGPAVPSGGWSVSYADGFGLPLGAGQDNTWWPGLGGGTQSTCPTATQDCSGSNSWELQVFNSSNQTVTSDGLKLTCKYLSTPVEPVNPKSGEGKKHYRCGAAQGPYCCHNDQGEPSGYNAPLIHVTSGVTYAFEVKMKLPVNTKEADPAFWFSGPPYGGCCELDMPELTGWGKEGYAGVDTVRWHWFPGFEQSFTGLTGLETSVHTYTTELVPGAAGKHKVLVWVDGVKKAESGEVTDPNPSEGNKNPLILQYALRECHSGGACGTEGGNGTNGEGVSIGFKAAGEERSTYVRSVAVYTDKSHEHGGVEHAGVAPGTTVE